MKVVNLKLTLALTIWSILLNGQREVSFIVFLLQIMRRYVKRIEAEIGHFGGYPKKYTHER
ncbi:hypothetical protein ACWIE6_19240 [Paenibacillus taichungensis]